jgi:hypothetical protein
MKTEDDDSDDTIMDSLVVRETTQQQALFSKIQSVVEEKLLNKNKAYKPFSGRNSDFFSTAQKSYASSRNLYVGNENEPGFPYEPCTQSWTNG